MTDPNLKPKLQRWQFRRRWLRYSLQTFLVLLTAFCVWLGWLANRANQQRHTVEWITELNGRAYYDYEFDENDAFVENAEPPGPDWLRNLIGTDYFANVVTVYLVSTQVGDVTPLAKLKSLEILSLYEAPVSDVTPLAKFTKLRVLILSYTRVSDVTPLANLKSLEELYLRQTQVSDVTPLANLKNLKYLNLESTQICDVTPLASLTNLVSMALDNTQVSEEDCELLQKSLPTLTLRTTNGHTLPR